MEAGDNFDIMASILRRPYDLAIVVCVFFFLLVAVTIGKSWECQSGWGIIYLHADFTQAVYGPIQNQVEGFWPPPQILRAYAWWAENYDPLLAKNPMW